MKVFQHIGKYTDLIRIVLAVLAAFVLILFFVLTQPVNLQRHNLLLSQFSRLQNDDARLGEAVLQLNFSLSNNYDQVTSIINAMRDAVHELRDGAAAQDLRTDIEFQRQLLTLEQGLAIKLEALERFKSRNAVLKNSLLYLPRARDELLAKLPKSSSIHKLVDALIEQVLLNRVKGALLERGAIEETLERLSGTLGGLNHPAAREGLEGVIRHVHQIDQFEREVPELVRLLTTHAESFGPGEAYRLYYDRQQQKAAAFRFFLLLATLLLLGYAVRALTKLRAQSQGLKLAASVFATASEGIIITDTHGSILDVNQAFTDVTGYTRDEVLGKNPRTLQSGRHDAGFYSRMWQEIRDSGQWQGEIWNRRRNGEIYPEWLTITAATAWDGQEETLTHYVATFSDITQRKQNEAEIFQLAFYDPLTNLPNRRLLMDRLRHIVSVRAQGLEQVSLLFIDVDNFKTLNDVKGHDVGDLMLQEIARRLRACVREGDTVARLGGDEFVVLLEGLSGDAQHAATQAKAAGSKILQSLNQPYHLKDFEHYSSCSIGIGMLNPEISADELLKHADTAMYEAKTAGRNAIRFFDPAMQSALEARAGLEEDLRLALERDEFVLHYQIQVDREHRAIGAEALIRWMHPQRGMVSPAAFIPVAEETGLIHQLGEWVLRTACQQIAQWQADEKTQDLVLAVNVSAKQFGADRFVNHVESILASSGIPPARLKLEITESMLLGDVENVIATMRELKGLGVSFSIDDFGTGYSSLQYLKRLPLDQLKIDQSFVRDICVDGSDRALVRTIIAMAENMGLGIIAEGVESEAHHKLLAEFGCRNYQGYFFGKPMAIESFSGLLAERG